MFKTVILTVSDRCFAGERHDKSGPMIEESLPPRSYTVVERKIVPDDIEVIKGALLHIADSDNIDLLITTGGTGFGPRDVTPEATEMVVQRKTPGIDFVMYQHGLKSTPHAVLSRATSGIRRNTLIINLPGNPSAVADYIDVLVPVLPHALKTLRNTASEQEHRFEISRKKEK
ncbi:MogA/MoaB family molybdenum cofactor biosynthesis protein [candidate division KSB1 bacterium]